ncbi:MAG TPA: hypothetical protein VM243_16795 [Phycisphaerae bacterium]|nr:hypothetical protein [Phycisphaerae bacterium]
MSGISDEPEANGLYIGLDMDLRGTAIFPDPLPPGGWSVLIRAS